MGITTGCIESYPLASPPSPSSFVLIICGLGFVASIGGCGFGVLGLTLLVNFGVGGREVYR